MVTIMIEKCQLQNYEWFDQDHDYDQDSKADSPISTCKVAPNRTKMDSSLVLYRNCR